MYACYKSKKEKNYPRVIFSGCAFVVHLCSLISPHVDSSICTILQYRKVESKSYIPSIKNTQLIYLFVFLLYSYYRITVAVIINLIIIII